MAASSLRRSPPRQSPADEVSITTPDGSFVLQARSRNYHWQGAGMLSIKSFTGGRALYAVDGGLHAVDDLCYLILNQGRTYGISVESARPVESFCVFFAPELASDALRNATQSHERLLDQPDGAALPVEFFERCYEHDAVVTPALQALRDMIRQGRPGPEDLAEGLHLLLIRLLAAHRRVTDEVRALPAARAATREEIYRRVYLARDYAAALLDRPITLDDMARVAGLSPNHFLRAFRQVLGETPRQYLTTLRLARARSLLTARDLPVTEVCLAVGFQSLGSFSWLFHRRVGVSPEAYRRQTR